MTAYNFILYSFKEFFFVLCYTQLPLVDSCFFSNVYKPKNEEYIHIIELEQNHEEEQAKTEIENLLTAGSFRITYYCWI